MGAPKYTEPSSKKSKQELEQLMAQDKKEIEQYLEFLKKKLKSQEYAKKAALLISDLLKQEPKNNK